MLNSVHFHFSNLQPWTFNLKGVANNILIINSLFFVNDKLLSLSLILKVDESSLAFQVQLWELYLSIPDSVRGALLSFQIFSSLDPVYLQADWVLLVNRLGPLECIHVPLEYLVTTLNVNSIVLCLAFLFLTWSWSCSFWSLICKAKTTKLSTPLLHCTLSGKFH